MKAFLQHKANRWGYDGWALRTRGDTNPYPWTVCTTREECRELRKERADLFDSSAEIVKVRISVEAV